MQKIYVPGEIIPNPLNYGISTFGIYNEPNGNVLRASSVGPLITKNKTLFIETNQPPIPAVGDIIIGQVMRISKRSAVVRISTKHQQANQEWEGIIQQKDIKPLDLVRARIIAIGEHRQYILSTAQNDLGVVMATSAAGVKMVIVDWTLMKCTKTGLLEQRKVANVKD